MDCYLIQSGYGNGTVNDLLMETLFFVQACNMASANKIVVILPYFPYSKKSKKKGRGGIPAKLIANMLKTSGADQVVVIDLHSPQIQGFFDIPVDNLHIEPFIIKYIHENIPSDKEKQLVIMAKNPGAVKRCSSVAKKLNCNIALMQRKINTTEDSKESVFDIIGDVSEKCVVFVDDMMSQVDSFVRAANVVKEKGGTNIYCFVTHGIFSRNSIEKLSNCEIDVIITTNSICQLHNESMLPKLKVFDISPLIAEVVRRINYGESLSFLENSVPF